MPYYDPMTYRISDTGRPGHWFGVPRDLATRMPQGPAQPIHEWPEIHAKFCELASQATSFHGVRAAMGLTVAQHVRVRLEDVPESVRPLFVDVIRPLQHAADNPWSGHLSGSEWYS